MLAQFPTSKSNKDKSRTFILAISIFIFVTGLQLIILSSMTILQNIFVCGKLSRNCTFHSHILSWSLLSVISFPFSPFLCIHQCSSFTPFLFHFAVKYQGNLFAYGRWYILCFYNTTRFDNYFTYVSCINLCHALQKYMLNLLFPLPRIFSSQPSYL
jgi:hypothetical protein